MLRENIRLALRTLRASKMRTALSLLGIMIGVASVIAITTLSFSAEKNAFEHMGDLGLEYAQVSLESNETYASNPEVTADFANELKAAAPEIVSISPRQYTQARVSYGAMPESFAQVYGINEEILSGVAPLRVGRTYSSREEKLGSAVVVIGSQTAKSMFGSRNPIGKRIELVKEYYIDNKPVAFRSSYEVIGVLEEKDASFMFSFDDAIFMPLVTMQMQLTQSTAIDSFILNLGVEASKGDMFNTVLKPKLRKFLSLRLDREFYIQSPAEFTKAMREAFAIFTMVFSGVAAISLLVGGIGIMNIMLVSVSERVKEIGIRKALGATARVIKGQFLTESAILTAIGGLAGSLMGIGLAHLVGKLTKISITVDPKMIFFACAFSAAVGIFFGWYPAGRAAKLDPIVALNHE